MDLNSFTTFKTLGEINTAISQAASLDAALKAGLKIIRDNLAAEMAVIWFYDKEGDRTIAAVGNIKRCPMCGRKFKEAKQ